VLGKTGPIRTRHKIIAEINKYVFKSLNHLPSLGDVNFGRGLELDPTQLEVLDLPPDTRVRSVVRVSLNASQLSCRPLTLFMGGTSRLSGTVDNSVNTLKVDKRSIYIQ
jgi:hypothetical protein